MFLSNLLNMEIDLSFEKTSLIAALSFTAYLVDQCITPPNPAPSSKIEYGSDSMQVIHRLEFLRPAVALIFLLHLALVLFPNHRSEFCRNADLLNDQMFSWSKTTVFYIFIIVLSATSRMAAYSQLGKNFTYRLAKPSGLVKTGFYAYVQHPSYTALLIVSCINGFTMLRFDSAVACILPRSIAASSWSPIVGVLLTSFVTGGIYFRVRDEEAMMRKEFGAEWEEWNRKTKKFIPFII